MSYAYRWPGLGTEPQLGLKLSGLLELEPLPLALINPDLARLPQLLAGPASLSAVSDPSL